MDWSALCHELLQAKEVAVSEQNFPEAAAYRDAYEFARIRAGGELLKDSLQGGDDGSDAAH